MGDELARRARDVLTVIGERTSRSYEPTALLEDDEVFLLTAEELPQRRVSIRGQDEEEVHPSALLELTGSPGNLPVIGVDDLRRRRILFYAAVFFERDGGTIAFVKKYRSVAVAGAGALVGLYGQTLRRVRYPTVVLADDFDLVIDAEEIAALTPTAIVRLFADVDVAAAAVPDLIRRLSKLPLALSDGALSQLEMLCMSHRLRARRLALLLERPHMERLTAADVRAYLDDLEEDSETFIDGEDAIVVSDANVDRLIEVLAQAHYRGGYDDELWRADRMSRITS